VAAGSTLAQPLTTPAATAVFNGGNQMSSYGSQTYTYDANGNRLTQSASGGASTYTWDGRNRLQSIADPNGVTTSFKYDFEGELIQQAVTAGAGTVTTRYTLDQLHNVVAIYAGGAAAVALLTGGAADSHLATVSGGQTEFALHDAVSSVVAITGAAATLDSSNLFEPFGQTTANGTSFPFAFTGRVPVDGGALYYYRSRFYDPATGRFLSEDTHTPRAADFNRYRYTRNSPVQTADPSGFSRAHTVFGGLNGWWASHVADPAVGWAPRGIR
jgi:RHS repeat-associated protein